MDIVLYTIPYEIPNEDTKINTLFEEGLDLLHIRKPEYSKKDLEKLIESINSKYHNRVVLHSHYSLSKKFKLNGIHVPYNYFNGFKGGLRKLSLKLNSLNISTSIASSSKLNTIPTIFDRVHIGPIFKVFSEENIVSNYDFFSLKKHVSNASIPVYALGGLNSKTHHKVASLGFEGLIFQSGVWKASDIFESFKLLKQLYNDNKIPLNFSKKHYA